MSDSSSSDDELLSLDVLQPWKYRTAISPLKSAWKQRHADGDAAEQSTPRQPAENGQNASERAEIPSIAAAAITRTGLSSKLRQPVASSSKQRISRARSDSSSDESERADIIVKSSKPRSMSPTRSRETSVVPDSEPERELESDGEDICAAIARLSIASRNVRAEDSEIPNAQRIFAKATSECRNSLDTRIASPSKERPSGKSRRLTIITIPSDSDDEENQSAPPLPFIPTDNRSPPDEESFADYTDDENLPQPRFRKNIPRIADSDSSDSENDIAAGVVTWTPSPSKPRKLQTQPRQPLGIPERMFESVNNIFSDPPASGQENVVERCSKTPVAKTRTSFTPKTSANTRTPSRTPATVKRSFAKERDSLAKKLIQELDEAVFGGQLPNDIAIVWNGRLNTTAGRASWKKTTSASGEKVLTCSIDLATKVIDSDAKLKNTLSHELCHIAAWAIDQEMKPAHGPAFKTWGRKVMVARKDITVTTRHSYEIAYKFQWQCKSAACGKVYGRHSKSIDPARHGCGVCGSRLIQLDKDGNPVSESSLSPRKESEWTLFSKAAFKRIKAEQPALSMTRINQLVAAEWKVEKEKRAGQVSESLEEAISTLAI